MPDFIIIGIVLAVGFVAGFLFECWMEEVY